MIFWNLLVTCLPIATVLSLFCFVLQIIPTGHHIAELIVLSQVVNSFKIEFPEEASKIEFPEEASWTILLCGCRAGTDL